MGSFCCYRLRDTPGEVTLEDLDNYIDDEADCDVYGPLDTGEFTAKLYVSQSPPHSPAWEGFIRSGFQAVGQMPLVTSSGAVVLVSLRPQNQHFAFTFGTLGRFLLRPDAWERGYGLRTALNLIYPRDDGGSSGKLVALDAKRRGGNIMRSRRQASKATSFEAFDVDKVRDLMGGATGTPSDRKWGHRITGGDAFYFDSDIRFEELGKSCFDLEEAHSRDDYTDKFKWVDRIRPILDPVLLTKVQEHIVQRITDGDVTGLGIAPPEIVDWSAVVGFRYHFDPRRIWRPELRLQDYLNGLASVAGWPESPDGLNTADFLRRRHVCAVDGDSKVVHRWPVWRCLTGEFEFDGATYVFDEGDIFAVSSDYLRELNESIADVRLRTDIPWPEARSNMNEDTFNRKAVAGIDAAVLMDKQLITAELTTPIELCDILTAAGDLIHVKRHFGSSDLSHLFSQGFVSAQLLQEDKAFRAAANEKVMSVTLDPAFRFFDTSTLTTEAFEIVFVIVAPWRGRPPAAALPFFSKVNLARTVQELTNKGFSRRDYPPRRCVRAGVEDLIALALPSACVRGGRGCAPRRQALASIVQGS